MVSKTSEVRALEKSFNVSVKMKSKEAVGKVRFRFSPSVWADLANTGGKLLPQCCANVSAMRDEFVAALRSKGWMDIDGMVQLVANMAGHEYGETHPATKVKLVLDAIAPWIEESTGASLTHDPSQLEDACDTVLFGKVFDFCSHYSTRMFGDYGRTTYEQAETNKLLFEVIPVIRTLAGRITEAGFPPLEGFGLFSTVDGNLLRQFRGLPVYPDQEGAERTAKLWVRTKAVKPEEVAVHAVRVSWEKGVEKLDEVKSPWSDRRPEGVITQDEKDRIWDGINELRKSCGAHADGLLREALHKLSELPVHTTGTPK